MSPRLVLMPELSRFFGIVIRMYVEGGQHHAAHFHAYYGDNSAVFAVDELELIAAFLPTRQLRLVEAWAEIHHAELADNWKRLQSGLGRRPIDPLR